MQPPATIKASPQDLLSLLRLVESAPAGNFDWTLHCATQQAAILRLHLPGGCAPRSLAALSAITGIRMQTDDGMPVPGTAFISHGHWHIHVSATLTPREQVRAALHELKHIVDHPARTASAALSPADYERIADQFADQVLREASP